MVGIALLGAGYAGRIQVPGWQQAPKARVVGVWNRTAARARALAEEHGLACFEDLEALVRTRRSRRSMSQPRLRPTSR